MAQLRGELKVPVAAEISIADGAENSAITRPEELLQTNLKKTVNTCACIHFFVILHRMNSLDRALQRTSREQILPKQQTKTNNSYNCNLYIPPICRARRRPHALKSEHSCRLQFLIEYVNFEKGFKQFQLNILATIFVTILKIIRVNTCTWPLEGLSYIATASLWPSARVTVILVAICMSNSKPLYGTILGFF